MTINIPEGFAQVTLNYRGPTRSGRGATVLGFALLGSATLETCAQAVYGQWEADLKGLTHDSWSLEGVTAVDETTGFVWAPSISNGTRSGAMSPPNVTVLMRKVTMLRGRANSGRAYWPGMTNDDDVGDDGSITTSRVNSIRSDLNSFFDALETLSDCRHCLLHNGDAPPTAITSITVESKVATQRRRLR